ncbi:serine hydrolase domain-containing protein [Streptomyces griseofuscus]|uniref:serine hydrolase domain-containing protein n=1 Tax=Streptomyces griseofuscus TaxID=146922 RepID=UPI0034001BA7
MIPVSVRFWREVTGHPLGAVTAGQLLTHTAGVPLRAQLKNLYGTSADEIRRGVLHEQLHRPPGEAVAYTDRAALVLGHLAEYLSGQLLDQPATTRTWLPMGMDSTRLGPCPPRSPPAEPRPNSTRAPTPTSRASPMTSPPASWAASAASPVSSPSWTTSPPSRATCSPRPYPLPAPVSAPSGPHAPCPSRRENLSRSVARSGTRPLVPAPYRTFGSTTASPVPACGSRLCADSGRCC